MMGNDNISAYQYLSMYGFVQSGATPPLYTFGTDPVFAESIYETVTANPLVTWETAKTWNVGFSAQFLNGKFGLDLDYFQSRRSDILITRNASIPTYSGLSLPAENLGKVKNHGFEAIATYRDRAGDFEWGVTGNVTYAKNEVIQDVLSWFDDGIDFLNYGNPHQELRMAISKSEHAKKLMLDMIQEMDLDIVDFRVEEREHDRIEVFTKHVVDDYEAELNLFDESSGTKKLFGLLPFIAKSLSVGTTLVIDELDAKIHPVLLKYIIMMFNDMKINRHGAQLIFTSHDLSTMNSEVFRRDEIWFVAKGNKENSKLYSLVEFKNDKGESVRKDAKFDKQYLEGKYGADPYLRKIIDWGRVNA